MADPTREEEISLMDIMGVLFRYRYVIIGLTIGIAALAWLYSALTRPVYEAKSLVRLSISAPPITTLGPEMGYGTTIDPVQSQIEIIKSRTLAERVVKRMGLNIVFPKGIIVDTAWSTDLVKTGIYYLKLKQDSSFEVFDKDDNYLGPGKLGKIFKSQRAGFGFSVRCKDGECEKFIGRRIPFRVKSIISTAERFRGKVKASQKGQTDLAVIKVRAYSPQKAAQLANAVAEEYVNFVIYDLQQEARSVRNFIESQLEKVERRLREAEDSLKAFKEKTGIFILDESARSLISRLSELQAELTKAQTDRVGAFERLKKLRQQLKQRGEEQYQALASTPEISGNPIVQSLRDKLTQLEIRKAKLLEEYTEAHPDVQALEREIQKTREELNKAIENMLKSGLPTGDPIIRRIMQDIVENEATINALDGKIQALQTVINIYEGKLQSLPEAEVKLAELTREVEANRATYEMLISKLQDVKITEARTVSDAKVIDPAVLPKKPIKPKTKLNIILGFILGLMLGVGGAFVLEYLDTSVKVPEEVETALNIPVLGTIPMVMRGKPKSKDEAQLIKERLITHFHPSHPVSEAFKTLRTNLRFSSISNPANSIVITSAVAREGKSTVTANLGITLAQLGHKTLLVDADLRKPILHRLFGFNRIPGLTDVLIGNTQLESVIKDLHRVIPNLALITCGQIPPNPSELLGSPQMEEFIKYVKTQFDYVLFDTPPIMPATDATELGARVDGIILVVRAGNTERAILEHAKKLLERANVNIIGAVLNAVDIERQFYYYKYRYKHYYYYYSYTHKDKFKEFEEKRKSKLSRFFGRIFRRRAA